MKATPKQIGDVVSLLLDVRELRQAVKFVSPDLVVKATAMHRARKNARSRTLVVTIGKPNYSERKFVADCIAAGEQFPVKKMRVKLWPKRRAS